MSELLAKLLLITIAIGGIAYLLREPSQRLKLARARFLEDLGQFEGLLEFYFIEQKLNSYYHQEVGLSAHPSKRFKANSYARLADEIEDLLENPEVHLVHKVYDPVDDSLLQEEAVEITCDHPTIGKVYVTVNHWNSDRVGRVFMRDEGTYSRCRYYRIRTERELPAIMEPVYKGNGVVLANAVVLAYLRTSHYVRIYDHEEPAQTWLPHCDDRSANMLNGERDAGHEETMSGIIRHSQENAILIASSGEAALFSKVFGPDK